MKDIVINKNNYDDTEKFWHHVSKMLDILTYLGYECVFKYEDCDIYVIEFDFNPNSGLADEYLMWLKEEEMEFIEDLRFEKRNKSLTTEE